MLMRLPAVAAVMLGLLSLLSVGAGDVSAEPAWTTYHHDPGRSGFDAEDGGPVSPSFAWQSPDLGAPIWSQPLVLGSRVYVATVGDRLYALEASTGKVIWQKSAGTPVPSEEPDELPCGDVKPTVGIVGTPVIDVSKNAIYAVADTWDEAKQEAHHVLKGFSLVNGEEVLSVPVDPPESDPKALLQRTALNLDGERIIFGFGGNDGDCSDYRGAVVSAPESSEGKALWWQAPIAPPPKWGGAVWAPSGPAVDEAGNVYATTGNPVPEGEPAITFDYSDAVVKLDPAQSFGPDPMSESIIPSGWFEPPDWEEESNTDADLSSAGAELLPGGLLFQAGKDGVGYLIDEATMNSGAPAVFSHEVCGGGNGSFGGDAYANGTIYVACTSGVEALAYNQTDESFTSLWQGPSDAFGPPIVAGGLVWVISTGGFSGGGTKLYALDPADGKPAFTETLPSPVADHFGSPSAAGGRLFLATGSTVSAYALTPLVKEEEQTKSPAVGFPKVPTEEVSGSMATGKPPLMSSTGPQRRPARGSLKVLGAKLHLAGRGRLVVQMQCLTASRRCAGRIVLSASIERVDGHSGSHRVSVALLRDNFRNARRRAFEVRVRLGRAAIDFIARHRRSITLHVRVVSSSGAARTVAIELS